MSSTPLLIHGHRGCRGLFPENTIPAFEHAAIIGVDAIELDVIITADKKVLVSHEPWLSHEYCLDQHGDEISPGDELSFNLFKIPYSEIKKFDCGTKKHPRFTSQINIPSTKPLLSDVIDQIKKISPREMFFNIEIKSEPQWYGVFQPFPEETTEIILNLLSTKISSEKYMLQSFNPELLKLIHSKAPQIHVSLLVEESATPEADINDLGFKPFGYNPYFKLINQDLVEYCRKNDLQLLAWTVNNIEDMKKMAGSGVNGIITDYPDRAIELFRSHI